MLRHLATINQIIGKKNGKEDSRGFIDALHRSYSLYRRFLSKEKIQQSNALFFISTR